MAVAMEWVYRVLGVVVFMVGPGLLGQWLDKQWDTGFLGLLGFAVGLTLGISALIAMTKPPANGSTQGDSKGHR